MKDRVNELLRNIPVAHRVVVGVAVAAFLLLGFAFLRWVTAPTYTVLYSGLDDAGVSAAIGELETLGTPYRIEAGGSRILVPRDQLYATRASLAGAGVGGESAPQGYELLDGQGLTVSDFRQRVDYQRALEGELAKTLQAMDAVKSATVRLVMPEKQLFTDNQQPTTASVLLDTARPLNAEEVETVTFLVSSSVEGLKHSDITVADVDGQVLASPGEDGLMGAASTRRQRQTRAFEESLAGDVTRLLRSTVGDAGSSVVVRAELDYDERSSERETYEPDSAVATREQTIDEEYTGTGAVPGGIVGVDGGPLAMDGGESEYRRDEATREFGVNREVVRTTSAPGDVEKLSVAIVMDDGSLTGATVPPMEEIETLVAAALGLDAERGDEVAVSMLPFPDPADAEEPLAPSLTERLPEWIALAVLFLIALGLFVMTRKRDEKADALPAAVDERLVWGQVREEQPAASLADTAVLNLGAPDTLEEASVREQLTASVTTLVEQQPEEIAVLLRSWLADRR
ncbi:MAG: flagellar M-ring protein FliF [Actinobacteria bacterium]|nr:flagellar M-ring protein FliF [Actinomycetota bacterium]